MSTDQTTQKIKQLMADNLTWSGSWNDVDEDYPLLAKQVIDSLGMLKLVSLIEEEFDVEIDDDDIVPDNWKSISRHRGAGRGEARLEASKVEPAATTFEGGVMDERTTLTDDEILSDEPRAETTESNDDDDADMDDTDADSDDTDADSDDTDS